MHVYLGQDGVCRVGDFGLEDMAAGAATVRWLALECVSARVFNVTTDVWAAAVVVWEILTLGATPYMQGLPSPPLA